jgi:hypothetical protein
LRMESVSSALSVERSSWCVSHHLATRGSHRQPEGSVGGVSPVNTSRSTLLAQWGGRLAANLLDQLLTPSDSPNPEPKTIRY